MSRPPVLPAARFLHPLAWWLWSLGLVAALVQTSNPLLLGLLALVVCYVVAARRTTVAPSGAFRWCALLAVLIVAVCLLVQVLAADQGGTSAGLLAAFCFGARIAGVVLCIGAATTLAAPLRLFGGSRPLLLFTGLPAAFARIRRGRRLRAVSAGHRPWLLPATLAEARAAARTTAASLQARGYGPRARLAHRWRWAETAVLLTGAAVATCFALTERGLHPDPWSLQTPSVPMLAAVGVLCAILPAHLTPAPPTARGARTLRTKAVG